MKVRFLKRLETTHAGWQEPGYVMEHKDAHWLVRMGLAEEVKDGSKSEPESSAESVIE